MGKAMRNQNVNRQTREPPLAKPLDTFDIIKLQTENSIKSENNLTTIKFKKNENNNLTRKFSSRFGSGEIDKFLNFLIGKLHIFAIFD